MKLVLKAKYLTYIIVMPYTNRDQRKKNLHLSQWPKAS